MFHRRLSVTARSIPVKDRRSSVPETSTAARSGTSSNPPRKGFYLNPPGCFAALEGLRFLRLSMEEIIMGWTVTFDSNRRQLIQERTRSATQADGTRWECLRHTAVGNVLWTVWEVTPADPKPPMAYREPYRYIGCDLLAPGRKGEGWGYKDLCESMGPCYNTCPLSYLDMAPVADADWRAQVRAWHASRKRKVDIGDVLIFEGLAIPEVKIVSKQGRRLVGEYGGCLYRIPPRILAKVVDQRLAA